MSNVDAREPPTLYLPPAHGAVWREGDVLVCTPGADLPPRCVKCNAPADTSPRRYIFHWHHPAIYLALLMGVLPYLILALVLRKRSAHVVTLCLQHERRRVRYAVITRASVLPLLAGGLVLDGAIGWLAGAGVMAVMLLIGRLGSRVLSPHSVDDAQSRFLGACDAFLHELPAPPRRARDW
ncbi:MULTISPECIES: hypothetical protein [Xanthomonas]|uniref:Uncharacterized protein n=2 Tax=Xanthomonas euroxanthea TaxID=2259622 RepID=A0A381LJW1_9XANT|nr:MULTISPECIES: hypothetical protein [Xanthomonas]SYZ50824.1 hypothetical protein CPBF367_02160 [Xanthomonas arboricola pv. juglandis]MCC4615065.1 hypothetical protein [Xanthomonas campestris pv. asclepiadis]CAD1786298.1 hypothetical protein XSP_000215 [Xanthomonas euroxanthea]CAE1132645.1 hypothetical protein XTG_000208 [Xanthomonas euroxanthea]SUZ26450.1 hypothetical protein CPBF424_02050 [Xanthomonas euroxanthea]